MDTRKTELQYQISFIQQSIAVQAQQISVLDNKFAVLLPVIVVLWQTLAAPVEYEIIRWAFFVLYAALAVFIVAILITPRAEVYTSEDELSLEYGDSPNLLTLFFSRTGLQVVLKHNETELAMKEWFLKIALIAGSVITLAAAVIVDLQPKGTEAPWGAPVPCLDVPMRSLTYIANPREIW